MRHSTLRVPLSAAYVLLIIGIVTGVNAGYLTPVAAFVHAIPGGDKLFHFLLLGGLAFFTNWFLKCHTFKLGSFKVLSGSVAIAIISTIEEFSQIWITTRRFDAGDLSMNLLGILGPLARRIPTATSGA